MSAQQHNKAPAPSRRPRFPLDDLGEYECLDCAPPVSPAAVGEAQSSVNRKHRQVVGSGLG
jgi:hypothetical protein